MDFEYHGALRDIAIEQMPVPASARPEMEQWDALMHDLDFDFTAPDAMTINPKALTMFPEDGVVMAQAPPACDAIPDERDLEASKPDLNIPQEQQLPLAEDAKVVTASAEQLQAQINQLREMVAQLANANQGQSRPAEPRHNRKQSLDSLRADSVFSRAGLPNSKNAASSVAGSSDFTEANGSLDVDMQPEDSPIYSRRGSASTISSIPSKRGQRIPGGYPCAQCDLAFDIPSQLKHHERKHLSKDERPFPCSQCSERFLFPKDLARHKERIHGIPSTVNQQDTMSSSSSSFGDGSNGHPSSAEEHYYSKQNWQSRISTVKRHESLWQQRDSRRATIKRKQQTLTRLASSHHLPTDVQNATILETEALNTTTTSHINAIRGLQIQIDLQQQTIDKLESKLAHAEEQAEAWLEERNTFAKVLQRTGGSIAARPGMFFEQRNKRLPTLTERAKGWLGAIDKLLSTSKSRSSAMDVQTGKALEHISSALDQLDLRDD